MAKSSIPFVKGNGNMDWLIAEGTYVFKVTAVEYDSEDGVLELEFINFEGKDLTKKFYLKDNDGEWKEKSLNFISYLYSKILQTDNIESFEPTEAKGKYVKIKITHRKYTRPGKSDGISMDISDFEEADGFEEAGDEPKKAEKKSSAADRLKGMLSK